MTAGEECTLWHRMIVSSVTEKETRKRKTCLSNEESGNSGKREENKNNKTGKVKIKISSKEGKEVSQEAELMSNQLTAPE